MDRRQFLSACAASAALLPLRAAGGPRITRILVANTLGRFHKYVAMNAYDTEPKGHTYVTTVLRVQTDQGVEGIGVMAYALPDAAFLAALKTLVGANPLELYRMEDGKIADRNPEYASVLKRYPLLDGPLLDLVGKLTGKAVWQLFGNSVRERVETYDSTLYFSDVWFQDRGVRAVVEEAEESQRSGYRALKLKLGRGFKWMEKDAGVERDIEVVRAVRAAVGPEMRIMADPNKGYQGDRERAWRLMAETAESKLYWMEQIFDAQISEYTWLKDKMTQAGIQTLIADGENYDLPSDFDPYLKPRRLMDVLQPDIRRCGLLYTRDVSRRGAPVGAILMTHNWASHIGLLMSLQIGKAEKNVAGVEDERSTCDVFAVEGYEFHQGTYSVPTKPGLSIHIDESVYAKKCKAKEIVIA